MGHTVQHDGFDDDGCDAICHQTSAPIATSLKHFKPIPKIINGHKSNSNLLRYQVFLKILSETNEIITCGGVLISNLWILTAAHCIYGARQAEIILGANNRNNRYERTQQHFFVKNSNFIVHANYPRLYYDIGLIKLPIQISFTEAIQPIRIPCFNEVNNNYIGRKALISGWGMTSDGIHGTSSCSGDSGGPLVLLDNNGQIEKLIGLVSFGFIGQCTKDKPQGYLKISSYLQWIRQNTNGQLKMC
ncbi:collagenase-like [Condylostylus longicornis]|uniref:collagenase-like n=1 Tax=Condylostylus longicornis TaxID=2530218 RepID=UPI00244DE722|nr:collagenase-like [Condylostylus longicornis]